MNQKEIVGKQHHKLLTWLRDTWIPAGPPVCFLEGFPGVGKSELTRQLSAISSVKVVPLEIPDSSSITAEDLLLNLAQAWNEAGNSELADVIAAGKDPLLTLARLLQNPVLIVMDEFQNAMTGEQAKLSGPLANLFEKLAKNIQAKGRILLLTNRLVERARWSEVFEKISLDGLDIDDGTVLLSQLLASAGREEEVPPEDRPSVVRWLGGNPRALGLFVASLTFSSLEELVSINPDRWEYPEELSVSPELIQNIERQMLERILGKLDGEFRNGLRQLSVFRKSFKNKALEVLFPQKEILAHFKAELINQFLMEHHSGWYSLHPIVREIGLRKLVDNPADLKKAHIRAASHYTRHFYAKDKTERLGTLGGYFTEARYHLVQAGDQEKLAEIAEHFLAHLSASFNFVTPIPKDREVLNERIAVLAAILESPGPVGLELHLARLYEGRRQEGDLDKAILHVRRALVPKSIVHVWTLAGKLLNQNSQRDEAIQVLLAGIKNIPSADLYVLCAELLAQNNQRDKAINLLEEGIQKVPIGSVFALYHSYAELLCLSGHWANAITLLWEGVEKVPVQLGGIMLVQALASQEAAAGSLIGLQNLVDKLGTTNNSATFFIHQLNLEWESAAHAAENSSYSNVIHPAFCWLGNNEPNKAMQALQKSTTLRYEKYNVNTWLMAIIQHQLGELKSARQYLSLYLGEDWTSPDAGILPTLLQLWDEADTPWGRKDLAYHFPILPAALTGLPHSVSRHMYASPVLPAHLKAIPATSSQPVTIESNPSDSMLRDKRIRGAFDVFLCHNSVDKSAVKKIGEHLMQFGLLPWLDEWELQPGRSWQRVLEAQISNIKSVAVFVGPDGIGPWQHNELDAFLRQFVKRDIPVIPVLLPECGERPTLPVFLESFTWVDFRKENPNPYHQLVWGVTGQRPEVLPSGALSQPAELLNRPTLIEEVRAAVQDEIARTREALMQQSDENLRTVLQHLTDAQVTIVQTLSQGIRETRFSEDEMGGLLQAIREVKEGNSSGNPALAAELNKLPDIFEDTKLGVAHKLKLSLPIIPLLLSYEGELNLNSGTNISKLIKNMLTKIRGG